MVVDWIGSSCGNSEDMSQVIGTGPRGSKAITCKTSHCRVTINAALQCPRRQRGYPHWVSWRMPHVNQKKKRDFTAIVIDVPMAVCVSVCDKVRRPVALTFRCDRLAAVAVLTVIFIARQ